VLVRQGSFTVPTGSQAFWTGYTASPGVTLEARIDSNNQIPETNENNNAITKSF
jgi:subtilase family serine protease